MDPLSRVELAQKYSQPEWQLKFFKALEIVDFLRDCIIEKGYKISDELNSSITLSESGRAVRDQLITKEKVPTKEANLLVLLALVYIDPLIDFETMDFEKLESAVSREVKSGMIRFPFIFGRRLYDRAAELFPEERRYLRHEDTLRLLADDQQGVFQNGTYTVGPLGLVKSAQDRLLAPRTSVPLQHCSDHSCSRVHPVQLTTSIEAGINKFRPALNKILDDISPDPSDWNGYVADILEESNNPFDVNDYSAVTVAIADGLDDDELQLLVRKLADSQDEVNEAIAAGSVVMDDPLDRTVLFQLLLLATDEAIVAALNTSIADGDVDVPEGEVRRIRLNQWAKSSAWQFTSEFSSRGVRLVGRTDGLPLLRLNALVGELFDIESPTDMDILAWALRNVPGQTVADRVTEYLRRSDPLAVVRDLVLLRRSNAEKVAAELHIDPSLPDGEFSQAVVWKLGFSQTPQPDLRDKYWVEHDRLDAVTRSSMIATPSGLAALRSGAVNYFVELETLLYDTILFATWVLLHDHYGASQAFVYREAAAHEFAIARLEEVGSDLSRRPTLHPLVNAFSNLSSLLVQTDSEASTHLRPRIDYPKFAERTTIQRFPFIHTVPYLDLLDESKIVITQGLAKVTSALKDSGITQARNALLHGNTSGPSPSDLAESLESARRAMQSLESLGLIRTTFQQVSREYDSWGRGTVAMEAKGGIGVNFDVPTNFRWLGFPSLGVPQYLVQGALFASGGQMLRFRRGYDSAYDRLWDGYPKWRLPGNGVSADQSDSLSSPMQTGAHIGSRAD